MRRLLLAVLLVLPVPALAQQQIPPADRAIALAMQLQQLGVAAQQMGSDMQMQLRAALNRVAELEAKCGEPCKDKAEPAK